MANLECWGIVVKGSCLSVALITFWILIFLTAFRIIVPSPAASRPQEFQPSAAGPAALCASWALAYLVYSLPQRNICPHMRKADPTLVPEAAAFTHVMTRISTSSE